MLRHSHLHRMHPRVRALYKELIWTASTYSIVPFAAARAKIKAAFRGNADLEPDSPEFRRALAWGRFEIKNMLAAHEVKQFRSLRDKYEDEESMFETPFSSLTAPTASAQKYEEGSLPRARPS